MVRTHSAATGALVWVLEPTRSMTWPQARRFLCVVAAVSLAIGGFFWYLGLPLVLPYSGLEAVLVAWAFYVVLRAGQRQEVVRLEDDRLVVERGARARGPARVQSLLGAGRLRDAPNRLHPGACWSAPIGATSNSAAS